MNLLYGYEGMDSWNPANYTQDSKPSPVHALIKFIGSLEEDRGKVDSTPAYCFRREEVENQPGFHYKTGSMNLPEIVNYWKLKGIRFETREIGGGRFISMVPFRNFEHYRDQNSKLPIVLTFHKENFTDPFWAMKTLDLYKTRCEHLAAHMDYFLIFQISNNGPDNRGSYQYMMREATQIFPGDKGRVYLDVSALKKQEISLNSVAGFSYKDEDGHVVENLDEIIEERFGTQVINVTDRWAVRTRRVPKCDGPDNGFANFDWIMHSEQGKAMLPWKMFAYNFLSPNDEGAQQYWKTMGLTYKAHHCKGERWVSFEPCQYADPDKKLPVVCVMFEVDEPNDDGITEGFGSYMTFAKAAAQGDCIMVMFVLESADVNDLLADIIMDAAHEMPIDLNRVYVVGHSHNGTFAQEFARRHPRLVTVQASGGVSPTIPAAESTTEAVAFTEEMVQDMSTHEMPTVIFVGCNEVRWHLPVNKAPGKSNDPGRSTTGFAATVEGRAAAWNRRLRASNCPERTLDEIKAAEFSSNKAERELGIPCDRAETIYINGFEHYVGDIKNKDGNYRLRIIGVQNCPHMPVPSMHELVWNYMRQFARDPETGKIIEIFK